MVQIYGPPLSVWYVKPSVISWLIAGRRAATDKATGKKTAEKTVSHESELFGITTSVKKILKFSTQLMRVCFLKPATVAVIFK